VICCEYIVQLHIQFNGLNPEVTAKPFTLPDFILIKHLIFADFFILFLQMLPPTSFY
jgi:hypothetical protein